MLKAFPRAAIGTAILLSGCQTPGWMAGKNRPADASSVAEATSSGKSLIPSFSKKTESTAAAVTLTKRGKEQLQAYYQDSSRPSHLQDAEKSFERALMVSPQSAEAHHGLAVCLDLQKRYPNAEEHYKQAIAADPGNATYIADLGYSYFLQARYADGEKLLQQALSIDPGNTLATRNLGMTYARQGKLDLAESTFRRVMNDAETRQALAQFMGPAPDIALASAEKRKPPAKDGSWDDVEARMEEARQNAQRERDGRDRQQQFAQTGVDPRNYRGRAPYDDIKRDLAALDQPATSRPNGPVYLDGNGIQAVPQQTAIYPESQHSYHPGGNVQPLGGYEVPANSTSWTPGAHSPHAGPSHGGMPYGQPPAGQSFPGQPQAGMTSSGPQSPPPDPRYGQPYDSQRPNGDSNPAAPPAMNGQDGGYSQAAPYGNPAAGYQQTTQATQPFAQGQPAINAYAHRVPHAAPPSQTAMMPAGGPIGYDPRLNDYGQGIQQAGGVADPRGHAHQGYDPARQYSPNVPQPIPAPGAPSSSFSPQPSAFSQSGAADLEQAKRQAAMMGMGVGPGPLFQSPQPPAAPQSEMSYNTAGANPSGWTNAPSGAPLNAPPSSFSPQPSAYGPPPGARDGVQVPGTLWNGAQSQAPDRQLPTHAHVPDLRNATHPQVESNWDLYKQQVNQLGQQTPGPSANYRTENQYSPGSTFNQTPPAQGMPTAPPPVDALQNYEAERARLFYGDQQNQQLLTRTPTTASQSPATEQRNLGPNIPAPSDLMTPTWGNQSIVPPAWPSRTAEDRTYRAKGYDQPGDSAARYDSAYEQSRSQGTVVPERYSAGHSSANHNSATRRPSPPTYGNSDLPTIVPANR